MSHFLNKKFDSLSLFFLEFNSWSHTEKINYVTLFFKIESYQRKVQFLGRIREKVHSLNRIQKNQFRKKVIFKKWKNLWVGFRKKVQFCESSIKWVQFIQTYWKEGSILWVIWKISIIWVIWKTRSNSLSHWKKLQVCECLKKKSPNLWIKFQKQKFQVFASGTILWVIWKINSLKNFSKKKFFKSFENMNHMQKVFDSLSRNEKKSSILWLWVVYIWQKFNSLNHIQKILWVILRKTLKFLESHWKTRKVQFFASDLEKGSILCVRSRKKFNSLRHTKRRGSNVQKSSLLWVMFERKVHFLSHVRKRLTSLNHIHKSSILWVIFIKKVSLLWVIFRKRFTS